MGRQVIYAPLKDHKCEFCEKLATTLLFVHDNTWWDRAWFEFLCEYHVQNYPRPLGR